MSRGSLAGFDPYVYSTSAVTLLGAHCATARERAGMWLMLQLDKDEWVVDARSEMVTTLIAQIIRFARPNIQIYDARVVDLYQWVCARYLVGVKRAETRQSALK